MGFWIADLRARRKRQRFLYDQRSTMNYRQSTINSTNAMNSTNSTHATDEQQKILVFQQNGSGESKIAGVRKHGGNRIVLEVFSIDEPLPTLVEDTSQYLPRNIRADLVLDFLKHPDLSQDLAVMCRKLKIPLIASGKKLEIDGVHTPPT